MIQKQPSTLDNLPFPLLSIFQFYTCVKPCSTCRSSIPTTYWQGHDKVSPSSIEQNTSKPTGYYLFRESFRFDKHCLVAWAGSKRTTCPHCCGHLTSCSHAELDYRDDIRNAAIRQSSFLYSQESRLTRWWH